MLLLPDGVMAISGRDWFAEVYRALAVCVAWAFVFSWCAPAVSADQSSTPATSDSSSVAAAIAEEIKLDQDDAAELAETPLEQARRLLESDDPEGARWLLGELLQQEPQATGARELLLEADTTLRSLIGLDLVKRSETLSASVKRIDPATGVVEIDRGGDGGFVTGMPIDVLRDGETVGRLTVQGIDQTKAVLTGPAEVVRQIQVGDRTNAVWSEWWFRQGVMAYQGEAWAEAAQAFLRTITELPGHEPSYRNLGLCYAGAGEWRKAAVAFAEAERLNPYNRFTRRELASASLSADRRVVARRALESLLGQDLGDIEAHYLLAFLQLAEDDLTGTFGEAVAVKNLDPRRGEAYLLLVLVHGLREEFPQAESRMAEGAEMPLLVPEAEAYRIGLMGLLARERGQRGAAAERFAAASSRDPSVTIFADSDVAWEEVREVLLPVLVKAAARKTLEASELSPFEQSTISQRIAEEAAVQRAAAPAPGAAGPSSAGTAGARVWSGKTTTTFEHYNRDPSTAFPMSGTHWTERIELKGKLADKEVKIDTQGFYNRWDKAEWDYYKINLKDPDDEIDIGEFSSAHYADLFKHGELKDGARYWRKFERSKMEADWSRLGGGLVSLESVDPARAPNIGRIYREELYPTRYFTTTEVTVVGGRTQRKLEVGEKKPENFNTYETSGLFARDVATVRISMAPIKPLTVGVALIEVKDEQDKVQAASTTTPIENTAIGIDGKLKLLNDKLELTGEIGHVTHDPNTARKNDDFQDVGSYVTLSYDPWKELAFDVTRKRVGKSYKLEGASQTADRVTNTYTLKYTASKKRVWRPSGVDLKYEYAHDNLDEDLSVRKRFETVQPKVTLVMPLEGKFGLDYKLYREEWTSRATFQHTKTLKFDYTQEIKPWKLTLKPAYAFERKDDMSTEATDERQKKPELTVEWDYVKNLALTLTHGREFKDYHGSSTRAYWDRQTSFTAKWAVIPRRLQWDNSYSYQRRLNSTTEDYTLSTVKTTITYTFPGANNRKLSAEFEYKDNPYTPNTTSAYSREYFKVQYAQDF